MREFHEQNVYLSAMLDFPFPNQFVSLDLADESASGARKQQLLLLFQMLFRWVKQKDTALNGTSWWLNQPIWKNMSQNGFIFPNFRVENKQIFELPPPREVLKQVFLDLFSAPWNNS